MVRSSQAWGGGDPWGLRGDPWEVGRRVGREEKRGPEAWQRQVLRTLASVAPLVPTLETMGLSRTLPWGLWGALVSTRTT